MALVPTDLNVISSTPRAESIATGELYTALAVYFPAYTFAGLVAMISTYRQSLGHTKEQLKYVFAGIALSFIPGFILNGALPLLGETGPAAVGPSVILIFVAFVSYAMLRHQLLDIRLVVARSVAYVLLVATLGTAYGFGAYGASSLFFGTSTASAAQQTVNVALAVILAFTFQPLRRFFEHLTDRIFFRDHYDSDAVLREVGKIVTSELLLDNILNRSLATLCRELRVGNARFVVLDKGKVYQVADFGDPPGHHLRTGELGPLERSTLVADELVAGRRKNLLDQADIWVSVPLRTKGQFVGFLWLGNKQSGGIYATQDLTLLNILGGELAVAIANAKAYQEIARFNVTLQQKVEEATKRLRQANRRLKALDMAKDEFISMAAHQLRTPLTAVKGYLSMLQEGDAGKLAPSQREFMDTAYDSTAKMVRLISDLLNVSRMQSGKFMINRTPTNLVEMVTNEVRQLIPSAQTKGLNLIFLRPRRRIPTIEVDEEKTRQVIMNFIDNALYYTAHGSVTVALTAEHGEVRLTVTDTGIGVPKAEQKKLFKKFFRAGNAQEVRPDGTGLGLYLAKRVVEDQGGRIIFETAEGKGSKFGFALPIQGGTVDMRPRQRPKGVPAA